MALSNWDCLAFDNEGNPTEGVIYGFRKGTSVEIYKNWAHVRDKNMWNKECHHTDNVIAQIVNGSIEISEFSIESIRGHNERAIFIYVECTKFTNYRKNYKITRKKFCGIGDISPITKTTYNEFIRWLKKLREDNYINDKDWFDKIMKAEPMRYNQGDSFFQGSKKSMTKIGEHDKSILSQALDKITIVE